MIGAVVLAASLASGPSAYTGALFDAAHEGTRQCIAVRESEGIRGLKSTNSYHGPYQMSDALVDGGAWMAMPELVKRFGKSGAVTVRKWMQRTPMEKWNNPWLQDLVFWAVYDHGAGYRHWKGGRWYCGPGMAGWSR